MDIKKNPKKAKTKHIIRNTNIFITILVIILNVTIFTLLRNDKNVLIIASSFFCVCFFFLYSFLMQIFLKNNVNEVKKEALYINYPLSIIRFSFVFLIVLIASTIVLFILNHDVFNITYIFMFYVSIISMLLPSILLLSFIYFIVPAFIIPGIQINNENTLPRTVLGISLAVFLIFSLIQYIQYNKKIKNITNQEKYKVSMVTIKYSTNFLKIDEHITAYGKKKLSKSEVSIPFIFTQEQINIDDYNKANDFCQSINARLPNYLEMYNIAFNNFDVFGENFYWTSNEDRKIPLVIHFKNMSYTLERYKKDQNPRVYCIANKKDYYGIEKVKYFINPISSDIKLGANANKKNAQNNDALLYKKNNLQNNYNFDDINTEKKHINFSIREVNTQIMQELLKKGYYYDTSLKISPNYEASDREVQSRIIRDRNKKQVRLCYFPFVDYTTLTLNEEAQIWSQSFCSPSFEVIKDIPEMKSAKDRNSYCASIGGRLPNIPELTAILNSFSVTPNATNYWTNTNIKTSSGAEHPVLATFMNARFAKLSSSSGNTKAYTYCIRNSNKQSKVISNYKSRFKNLEGAPYARAICPDCQYYEIPDTILQRY